MSTDLTTGPDDDTAVTAALRAVMALDGMQQAAFAARLAAMDARFADGLGVLVLDAVGLTMPAPPRRRGPSEEFRRRIAELAKEVEGPALDISRFDVPADARWIATDHDGALYAFTDRPGCFDGKHWMSDGERSWYLGQIDMTGIYCRKTLTPVNQSQQEAPERHETA